MGVVILIIAIIIIVSLINSNNERKEQQQSTNILNNIKRNLNTDLKVKYFKDMIETENGKKLPCYKVTASGAVKVPYQKYPCTIFSSLVDVTDKNSDDIYPVLCTFPEFADEDGFLRRKLDIEMPHEISTFEDLPIMIFPPEAMMLPKRGKRQIKVNVAICPKGNEDRCFNQGSVIEVCTQKKYGYMEQKKRSIETNELIARIAIAVCASDGHIDKRETAIVKNFFAEQFARLKEPNEVKQAVNIAFKETLSAYKANSLDVETQIKSACKKLVDACRTDDIHATYELAVKIVSSDEKVQDEEHAALRKLAQLLEIPADLAKDIQDKNFTVSMFAQVSKESMLNMPPELTNEQKVQFLNKEYQKWRARVNHQDTKVRVEAEMRIQAITKLRHELEKERESA
ncbi:MAG: TerB family tellurite resistance protein [Sedimentisphaerales bacterium]|nr:TerB family tellurite resistance protein [Sedimentisphaerales bacterium]